MSTASRRVWKTFLGARQSIFVKLDFIVFLLRVTVLSSPYCIHSIHYTQYTVYTVSHWRILRESLPPPIVRASTTRRQHIHLEPTDAERVISEQRELEARDMFTCFKTSLVEPTFIMLSQLCWFGRMWVMAKRSVFALEDIYWDTVHIGLQTRTWWGTRVLLKKMWQRTGFPNQICAAPLHTRTSSDQMKVATLPEL